MIIVAIETNLFCIFFYQDKYSCQVVVYIKDPLFYYILLQYIFLTHSVYGYSLFF